MLLYGSLPGQERRNERFASRAGIALAARSAPRAGAACSSARSTEPELLEHLRERMRRVRRPDAAPPHRRRRDSRRTGCARDRPRARAGRRRLGRAGRGCPTCSRRPARWRGARDDRRRRAHLRRRARSGVDAARVLDAARRGRRARHVLPGRRARGARARTWCGGMAAEGHEVGNHSWSHRSLVAAAGRARPRERSAGPTSGIAALTGTPPRHFRPPWGMVNAAMFRTLRRVGERCVFWSIQPEGQRPAPAARQVDVRAPTRPSRRHRRPARRRGHAGGAGAAAGGPARAARRPARARLRVRRWASCSQRALRRAASATREKAQELDALAEPAPHDRAVAQHLAADGEDLPRAEVEAAVELLDRGEDLRAREVRIAEHARLHAAGVDQLRRRPAASRCSRAWR